MQQEQTIKDLRARVRALESEAERRSPQRSVATVSTPTPLLDQEVAHSKRLSEKIRELDAANCRLEEVSVVCLSVACCSVSAASDLLQELFEEQQLRKKQQDDLVRHKDDLTDEIGRLMREVQALVHDRDTMRQQHEAQIAQIRHGDAQSRHMLAHERDALLLQSEQLTLEKQRLQQELAEQERQASTVRAEHQAAIAAMQDRERGLSLRLGTVDETSGSLLKERAIVVELMQEQARQISELVKREEKLAKRVDRTVAELAKERKLREFHALRVKELEIELSAVPPRSMLPSSHAEPMRHDAIGPTTSAPFGTSHYGALEPLGFNGPHAMHHRMAVSAEANATLNDWIASFSKAAPQTRDVGDAISAAREQEMKIWHETLLNKLKRVVKKVDRRLKSATDQLEDLSGDSSDGRPRSVSLADLQELKEAQRSLETLLREKR